jgi:hypothetical protein
MKTNNQCEAFLWLAKQGGLSTALPSCVAVSSVALASHLPPNVAPFSGEINPNAAQSKPCWPAITVLPKDVPNILLIMTDGVGLGAPSTFGGVIPTPALDRAYHDSVWSLRPPDWNHIR